MAFASRFCEAWITNTIRKVTMVVVVLMTSCHVSEKPKSGPVTAHRTSSEAAATRANGEPTMVTAAAR